MQKLSQTLECAFKQNQTTIKIKMSIEAHFIRELVK